MGTKIEWTEETWNPVTGCTKISPGCQNCYAERMSKRLAGRFGYPVEDPFKVTVHPNRLDEPNRWRDPRRVFVCSMGDLFHEDVPWNFIYDMFEVMASKPRHTFQVLTKRPDRMRGFIAYYRALRWPDSTIPTATDMFLSDFGHIWLGVTAENQEQADKRIPLLLQTPAAKRFVSIEPMLGPVDFTYQGDDWLNGKFIEGHDTDSLKISDGPKLDWVIGGGESGPGARPMHPKWIRSVRDQCVEAGTPFFFKQWGEWVPDPDGDRCVLADGTNLPNLEPDGANGDGSARIRRAGRKAAGRLLDGVEWNQFPEGA